MVDTVQKMRQPRALWRQLVSSAGCAALLLATLPPPAMAQDAAPPGGPPPGQPADNQGYNAQQLDSILAPIALYPDQLLTQVLMASAYPDQVKAAADWANNPANHGLQGDALNNALVPLPWDPSVKALAPFPQVLSQMVAQPDWLQQLGYAMSVQQPAVMDAVQRLRQEAQAAGQLHTTPQQVVSSEGSSIVIQPAEPNVVYVPTYNPEIVYGAWPYPAYPPFYWEPPIGFGYGPLIGGFAFGVGVGIVGFGLWGWAHPNWGGRALFVNAGIYNRFSLGRPWYGGAAWRPFRPVGRPGFGFRAGVGFRGGAGFRAGGGFRAPAGGFHVAPGAFHSGGFHAAPGFHGATHAGAAHSGGAAHSYSHSASPSHSAGGSHMASHAAYSGHSAGASHAGGYASHASAPRASAPAMHSAPRAAPAPRAAAPRMGSGGGHAGGGGGHHR